MLAQAGLLRHVHEHAVDYARALAPHTADPTVAGLLETLLGCISRDDATCDPDPPKEGGTGSSGGSGGGGNGEQQSVHERLAFASTFVQCCLREEPRLPPGLLTAAFNSLTHGWTMIERSLR